MGASEVVGAVVLRRAERIQGRTKHQSRRQRRALHIFIFVISILKTNYFFLSSRKGGGGRRAALSWAGRRRGGDFSLFSPSVFSPLFSLFFNRCKND